MDKSEAQYYSHRLIQEREAAQHAAPVAAAIHRQLAEKYAEVVALFQEDAPEG